MRIKALTLHEPWASLVAHGHKIHETRSWSPLSQVPIDGLFAIHAGKNVDQWARTRLQALWPDEMALVEQAGLQPGRVVSVVRLVGAVEIINPGYVQNRMIVGVDYDAGDFSKGRYAWRLEVVHRLDPPVEARGCQGFWWWDVPEAVRQAIEGT